MKCVCVLPLLNHKCLFIRQMSEERNTALRRGAAVTAPETLNVAQLHHILTALLLITNLMKHHPLLFQLHLQVGPRRGHSDLQLTLLFITFFILGNKTCGFKNVILNLTK